VETGIGEGENGPQIQCYGVGMHLLERRMNTYEGAREYKCCKIHQHSGGQNLAGYC